MYVGFETKKSKTQKQKKNSYKGSLSLKNQMSEITKMANRDENGFSANKFVLKKTSC